MRRFTSIVLAGCSMIAGSQLIAQSGLPPVRPLGAPRATSTERFTSISIVRTLGGNFVVNDPGGRRLVLLDSALRTVRILSDSTSDVPYGARSAGLLSYDADSLLFIETTTPAMYALAPDGTFGRPMAVPIPRLAASFAQSTRSSSWPERDPRGRMIYSSLAPRGPNPVMKPGEVIPWGIPDSSGVSRIDPTTRASEVLAWTHGMPLRGARIGLADGRGMFAISNQPMPTVDDFVVLPDGTIAIMRGDYHLELIDMDGAHTQLPRTPYPWERMTDSAKTFLIDSLRRESDATRNAADKAGASAGSSASGRSGGGMSVSRPTPEIDAIARQYEYVKPSEIPDYRPAFGADALRGDALGRVWVKTLQRASRADLAIYDVIDRTGKVVDRVELPAAQRIVGFDRTSVYLSAGERGNVSLLRVSLR